MVIWELGAGDNDRLNERELFYSAASFSFTGELGLLTVTNADARPHLLSAVWLYQHK